MGFRSNLRKPRTNIPMVHHRGFRHLSKSEKTSDQPVQKMLLSPHGFLFEPLPDCSTFHGQHIDYTTKSQSRPQPAQDTLMP